uniref:LruC domain-containing protein n=1 Tax=Roseihalotalea indica TaxID=2867963 RepID=A0AA49GIV3_9BACT|nr:LruC domain-containing protein [Tunicatimonas sp. TK19036]
MKKTVLITGLAIFLLGCEKIWQDEPNTNQENSSLDQAIITEDFDFKTTSEVNLTVSTLDNEDKPLSGVYLSVYYVLDTVPIYQGKGITAADGTLKFSMSLPSFVEELIVETEYIGLPRMHTVAVQDGDNQLTVGGRLSPATSGRTEKLPSRANARQEVSSLSYLSSYDGDGVPNNLLPVNDYISQDLLDLINTTLPERYPVPTYNPEYLSDDLSADAQLRDSAEVWITFVHEGAGWRNTLGYYTYDLSTPPQSVDDIEDFYVIFPNVSFKYEGGNLQSGNKVSLGTFPANTGIGWFLIPNAWNGSEPIVQSGIKYSEKDFNTFTGEQYRQHTVLLKDKTREILLLGMEDTSRPGGDNDFNDAVFYVSANPFEALITDNLESTKTVGNDIDGDGVADQNDAYPNDATRAFDIYTPGENSFGSVGFEDNWPQKGDYDMNDVVVEYNYQFVTNASNRAIEMIAQYKLVATGASYSNGFGVELPVAASQINTATITGATSQFSVDGKEAGQDNAVFIIFDDAHAAIGASGPVNTVSNKAKITPVNFELRVTFTEPIALTDLGYAPFNPFIFVDGDRGREVHLPDYAPTQKAEASWFGNIHDTSDPAQFRYYKSSRNLPWAINVPVSFEYPEEYAAINIAHKKFTHWAEQGGKDFKDWYLNKTNYRDVNHLYK